MLCDELFFGKYLWEEMGKVKYIKGYIFKIYRVLNIIWFFLWLNVWFKFYYMDFYNNSIDV